MFPLDVAVKHGLEILGFGEPPDLLVTARLGDPNDERLQFSHVIVPHRQIDAETIPTPAMSVLEMFAQSCTEVAGEAHVIEVITVIERVHAMLLAYKLTNHVVVLFEYDARDAFKMLGHEWLASVHIGASSFVRFVWREPKRPITDNTGGS